MELIAAIDLLDGRAVRLRLGNYGEVIGQADSVELACRWVSDGVTRLHVVDLDGARIGSPRNLQMLSGIVGAARAIAPTVQVQAGGGLRNDASVDAVLAAGADQAIVGTAAVQQPGFLAGCAVRWPGRILAALDVRGQQLAVRGWLGSDEVNAIVVGRRLVEEGTAGLVVTDTCRDGMLVGPNLDLLTSFRSRFPEAWLAAAGGIHSTDDLIELDRAGMDAAIAGMSLLTGTLQISDALAALAAPHAGAMAPAEPAVR